MINLVRTLGPNATTPPLIYIAAPPPLMQHGSIGANQTVRAPHSEASPQQRGALVADHLGALRMRTPPNPTSTTTPLCTWS